jgi:hypothetical protein
MPRGEPARKRQSWSRGARPPEPEAQPEAPAADAGEADIDGVPILDTADEEAEEESQAAGEDETETPGPDQA